MTLNEYLEREYFPSRFLRPNTLASYRRACLPYGSLPLQEVATSLHAWATKEIARGCSPYTVRGQLVVICCVLSHAVSRGVLDAYRRPQMPRCPRKIVRATSPEEIHRLVTFCLELPGTLKQSRIPRALYWSAFVAVSYETAMRTSDVLQLRMADAGLWYVTQIKTGRPVSVSVGPHTLDLVRQLAAISPTLFDRGWSREWYCRGIRRIAASVGIAICPQQLRQSAASEAERLKPGSAWVLLGHGSPSTTQRWYIDTAHAYADLPRPRIPWK